MLLWQLFELRLLKRELKIRRPTVDESAVADLRHQ